LDFVNQSRQEIGARGSSIEIVPISKSDNPVTLRQLYQLLIHPIAHLLPRDPTARVVFLPHRSLFLVSFPALQDKQGKFLIEKHTVQVAPAIQVLQLTRRQQHKVRHTASQNVLVVGNPTMPFIQVDGKKSVQLSPLPSADIEANQIAQLLHTQALIGEQATETVVRHRLPHAYIAHLATHGLLEDLGGGLPGAIALAPSKDADGLLTSAEILKLKLNAELVVLSACDTGRGGITEDGVVGLSRSLITAGVPSVIVSLWSVSDAPTAELMVEFYRNWQQRKMDKAQALRQAMLTTMKTHPNPKNWAAFTLVGEAK
jgi:CHAT domain-containing protein